MRFFRSHKRKFYITFFILLFLASALYGALKYVFPRYIKSQIPEYIQYGDMLVEPFTGLFILRDVRLLADSACDNAVLAEAGKLQAEISTDNYKLMKLYLGDVRLAPKYHNGKICRPPKQETERKFSGRLLADEGTVIEIERVRLEKTGKIPALNISSATMRVKETPKDNLRLIQILNFYLQMADDNRNQISLTGTAEIDQRVLTNGKAAGSRHIYSQGKLFLKVPSLQVAARNTKLPFRIMAGSANADTRFTIKQGFLDSEIKLMLNGLKLSGEPMTAGPLGLLSMPPQSLVEMLETRPGKVPFILNAEGDLLSRKLNLPAQIKNQLISTVTKRAETKIKKKLMFWK